MEVTATGADLDFTTALLFSHTNLVATLSPADQGRETARHQFRVNIGHDVPVGIYEARAIGRFGISNPRAFAVGSLPEINSSQTNTSLAAALQIPVGTVVNAHAAAGAVSYFRFAAKHDQRLLVECAAHEIDSRLEPDLFVSDARGVELERSRRKGFLEFTARADGDYILRVQDSLFRGGDEFPYRLIISSAPHLDFVFPPAGLPATHASYTVYGRMLPQGELTSEFRMDGKGLQRLPVTLEMPATPAASSVWPATWPVGSVSAGVQGLAYRLGSSNDISNPLFITAAFAPTVLEVEPNDTPLTAQSVMMPCEYQGRFYPVADKDWLSFQAIKGEAYEIEVISHRLGLPTSPFLLIQRVGQNARGEEEISDVQEIYGSDTNIGGVEYKTSSRDPVGRIEAKQDARYRVQVRDLFNSGQSDPARVYRLLIRKEVPDFRLLAVPQPPPQPDKERREARVLTLFLRRGETVPVKVMAFRRGHFEGEIQLNVEGLPPTVGYTPVSIETSRSSAILLLSASGGAGEWRGPVRIVGTGRAGQSDLAREASAASVVWDVNDYNMEAVRSRLTDSIQLAVARDQSAPLVVEGLARTYEGHPADKIQIPLKLLAKADLVGNLKLKPAGLTALESVKELEISARTNQANLELDLAQLKVPVGTHSFYVFAQGQAKYRRLPLEDLKAAEAALKSADTNVAKAAAQSLQFEERSFTAYSSAFTLRVSAATGTNLVGLNAGQP